MDGSGLTAQGCSGQAQRIVRHASLVHYLPILTTVLSALFAASLYRRWRVRRSPHLWWWAFGITTYGLGTAIESTITLFGNTARSRRSGTSPARCSAATRSRRDRSICRGRARSRTG